MPLVRGLPDGPRVTQRDPRRGVPRPGSRGVARTAVLATALAVFGPLAADARAARSVSASFGVLGVRTVYATATTTGVPSGERVVLEGRRGASGRTAVRGAARLRSRTARLRWTYPPGRGALHLRVRVVRGTGARARTLATSAWRTLRTGNMRRGAPLAAVAPGDVERAPLPGRPGELVLRGTPRISAGDAVALPAGTVVPEGLLVLVRSVRRDGGRTVARVRPTTLPQVMPVGELDVSVPVPERTSGTAWVRDGLVQAALPCAGGVAATVTGRLSLAAGLALRAAWRTSTTLARANLTADLRADVRASVDTGLSVAGATTCGAWSRPVFPAPVLLHRISTSIGPLPVTITAVGRATVSGSASTLGPVSTAATGETRGVARVVYDGIEASARGRVGNDLRLRDTSVNASGGAEAGVMPTVDVRMFGLPGPRFDVGTVVRTRADIRRAATEPWWNANIIDELGARFALGALRPDLEDTRVRVAGDERTAARAPGPAGGSAVLRTVPSPVPLPPGVRVRVTGEGDADVDLHAWDAGGRHLSPYAVDAIPGVALVRGDGRTLADEEIRDADPARPLTFGVCLDSGTESAVTVDVRDPDGTTLQRVYTLRGFDAAALVTVSPSGVPPYAPPTGWCGRDAGDPTAPGEVTTGDLPRRQP